MPTLFKRSNGIYYAILTDKLGRRKWISTKESTHRSALKKLVQMADNQDEQIPRVMLQTLYDDFKAYAGKVYSPETVVVYDRAFKKLIEHCGNKNLAAISRRDIDTYKAKRMEDISSNTQILSCEHFDLRSIPHYQHRNPCINVWGSCV